MDRPVFGKRESRPYDYKEMTWGKFIKLREWGKKAAQEIGYPIYLVGSTLTKEIPRDFDIVIEIPLDEYENLFGELTKENVYAKLGDANCKYSDQYFECVEILGGMGNVPLDFKVYPNNWFVDEDKLLLGEPINVVEKGLKMKILSHKEARVVSQKILYKDYAEKESHSNDMKLRGYRITRVKYVNGGQLVTYIRYTPIDDWNDY